MKAIRNIANRIFYRFYRFYANIEDDKVMVFYFTSFAISFINFFYLYLFLGLLNEYCLSDQINISWIHFTVAGFTFIIPQIILFFKNKRYLSEMINQIEGGYKFYDLLVLIYTTLGFVSLFLGAILVA
jgi:hypothetical protein